MKKVLLKTALIISVTTFVLTRCSVLLSNALSEKINPDFQAPTVLNRINITAQKPQNGVRVMTYNILADGIGFEGSDTAERFNGVCDVLNTLKPDVVGLQETSRNWYTYISQNTDYTFLAPLRTSFFGTMTAVVYNKDTLTLLTDGAEVFEAGYTSKLRRMVWGVFEHKTDGKIFAVINTHFSLTRNDITVPMKQAAQLKQATDELRKKYRCPIFLTGDFNARERNSGTNISSSVYETLCAVFTDTKTVASTLSYGSQKSIKSACADHIFLCGDALIEKYFLLSQKEFTCFSDHFPIFVDFII